MGSSLRVFGLFGVVLAAGLAACGGGGATTPAAPSPTNAPTATPTPTSAPTATPTAGSTATPTPGSTSVPATWTFAGPAATMTATAGQTPAQVNIAPYSGFSGTIQGAAVVTGSGTLSITTALNNGDVTPNTLPADNAAAGFTPVLYASFYNGGAQTISFGPNTPALTLTKSGGYGAMTQCELDVYAKNGGPALTWSNTGVSATISGTLVALATKALPAPSTVDFNPGQQVVAIACK